MEDKSTMQTTDVVLQSGEVLSGIAIAFGQIATDDEISRLAVKYDGLKIDGLSDAEGFEKVKSAKATMVRLRSALEATRKEQKADVLVRGRAIDKEANRIFDKLKPIEAPLTAELEKIKVEQERIAEEEKARKLAIFDGRMMRLAEIDAVVAPTIVAQMDEPEWLERYSQEYEDFSKREEIRLAAEAAEAKRKADAEAEADRVRVEGERLAEERRAFEAEKREAASKAKAEADRVQEENRKAQAAIDADRAEVQRQAAEIEEAKNEAVICDDAEDIPGGVIEQTIDLNCISLVPPGEHPPETAIKRDSLTVHDLRVTAIKAFAHEIRTFEILGHAQVVRREIQSALDNASNQIESLVDLIKESK